MKRYVKSLEGCIVIRKCLIFKLEEDKSKKSFIFSNNFGGYNIGGSAILYKHHQEGKVWGVG